jgi:predicted ATP-dependent serine protease
MAKIISVKQLREKKFQIYEFEGEWKLKIGSPEVGFNGLIYGPPKSGKSVELLRFVDYFAKHHGKVLYNSCEEKHSKTLQDNLIGFNINAERLFFSDGSTFDELLVEVKRRRIRLLVIDSVQYMGFNYTQYKDFKKKFPKVALILVNQINGRDKIAGGKTLLHAVDFTVSVDAGLAEFRSRFLNDGYYSVRLFSPKQQKKNPQTVLFDYEQV